MDFTSCTLPFVNFVSQPFTVINPVSTKTRKKIVKVMERKEKLRILNLNFLFCFINLFVFTQMNYSLDYFSSIKRLELSNMST